MRGVGVYSRQSYIVQRFCINIYRENTITHTYTTCLHWNLGRVYVTMGFIFNWPHSLMGRTNRKVEFDKYCTGHYIANMWALKNYCVNLISQIDKIKTIWANCTKIFLLVFVLQKPTKFYTTIHITHYTYDRY